MLFKPALADSDFVLMDISAENLAYSMKFAEKLKRQQASPMRTSARACRFARAIRR
jgi:alpha-galactosidase/6-phospho-beta-glucosidase family protein